MTFRSAKLSRNLGQVLVGSLLAMGLMTVAAGCVIPQEDHVLEPLPDQANRPPRIILGLSEPASSALELQNGVRCALRFSVAAEDPDVDDALSVVFYVDYDANRLNPTYGGQVLKNTGTATRPPVTLTFESEQPGLPLFALGDHFVDVVVADGAIQPDRTPVERETADDAGLPNPSYAVMRTWFVRTVPGDCL